MLGDQAVKPKTSFKGIRRKRKTVAFTDPTYVDYSDFDYSTDEEDIEELFGTQPQSAREQAAQAVQDAENKQRTDDARVEPLRTRETKSEEAHGAKATNGSDKAVTSNGSLEKDDSGRLERDDDDTSSVEEIIDETTAVSRSKNGTVRNTDSFFNDEETKKISLTPNLLRDDNANATAAAAAGQAASRPSTDSTGKDSSKGRSSLDKMERELVSDKERKKGKEKKPSAIRSFFSRKDKKKSEDDDESFGKRSMDIMDPEDRSEAGSPDKNLRKLQKSQKSPEQPATRKQAPTAQAQKSTVELSSYLNETRTNDVSSVPPASMRIVDPETQETRSVPSNQAQQPQQQAPETDHNRNGSVNKPSALSKIIPHRTPSNPGEPKPQKTVKAKTRMELDASDSSEVEEEKEREQAASVSPKSREAAPAIKTNGVHSPASPATSRDRTTTPQTGALQRGDPAQGSPNASNPPALVADTSSTEDRSPDASPSPELMSKGGSAASSRKDVWDDVKLRAFFDESEHIRDLLAVVYDKSDVDPVGADHPAVGGLFREQNAKLAEITTQLDNLLGDWLARKQRMRGSS